MAEVEGRGGEYYQDRAVDRDADGAGCEESWSAFVIRILPLMPAPMPEIDSSDIAQID